MTAAESEAMARAIISLIWKKELTKARVVASEEKHVRLLHTVKHPNRQLSGFGLSGRREKKNDNRPTTDSDIKLMSDVGNRQLVMESH